MVGIENFFVINSDGYKSSQDVDPGWWLRKASDRAVGIHRGTTYGGGIIFGARILTLKFVVKDTRRVQVTYPDRRMVMASVLANVEIISEVVLLAPDARYGAEEPKFGELPLALCKVMVVSPFTSSFEAEMCTLGEIARPFSEIQSEHLDLCSPYLGSGVYNLKGELAGMIIGPFRAQPDHLIGISSWEIAKLV